jgi:hypothetical protein
VSIYLGASLTIRDVGIVMSSLCRSYTKFTSTPDIGVK